MTTITPEFRTALDAFVATCQKAYDDNMAANMPNFPANCKETFVAEILGKFARIMRVRIDSETSQRLGGSAYGFVALADNETKTLGRFKTGDVFMAASYKAPARHVRGTIFGDTSCVGPYGIAYLR